MRLTSWTNLYNLYGFSCFRLGDPLSPVDILRTFYSNYGHNLAFHLPQFEPPSRVVGHIRRPGSLTSPSTKWRSKSRSRAEGLHNVMGTEEDRFQGRSREHTWLGFSFLSPHEFGLGYPYQRHSHSQAAKTQAFYGLSWPGVVLLHFPIKMHGQDG